MVTDSDGEPVTCVRCEQPAAYYVGIEHAIDDTRSEAACLWLCGAHYALWVPTMLAICRTAIEAKPDDDLRNGEFQIDVSRADGDEEDVGGWTLCATHGQGLWELAT